MITPDEQQLQTELAAIMHTWKSAWLQILHSVLSILLGLVALIRGVFVLGLSVWSLFIWCCNASIFFLTSMKLHLESQPEMYSFRSYLQGGEYYE